MLSMVMELQLTRDIFGEWCRATFNADSFLFLDTIHSYTKGKKKKEEEGKEEDRHTLDLDFIQDIAKRFLENGATYELNVRRADRERVLQLCKSITAATDAPSSTEDCTAQQLVLSLADLHRQICFQVKEDLLPRFMRDPRWMTLHREAVVENIVALQQQQTLSRMLLTKDDFATIRIDHKLLNLVDYLQQDDLALWDLCWASNDRQIFALHKDVNLGDSTVPPLGSFKIMFYIDKPAWMVYLAFVSMQSMFKNSATPALSWGYHANFKRGDTDPDTGLPFEHPTTVASSHAKRVPLLSLRTSVRIGNSRYDHSQSKFSITSRTVDQSASSWVKNTVLPQAQFPHKVVADEINVSSIVIQSVGNRTRFSLMSVVNMGGWLRNKKIDLRKHLHKTSMAIEKQAYKLSSSVESDPIEYCKMDMSGYRWAFETLFDELKDMPADQWPRELVELHEKTKDIPECQLRSFVTTNKEYEKENLQ